MTGKLVSGIIALGYLGTAWFTEGGETAFKLGIFLIFPLACIWFSEPMGTYSGMGMGRPVITSSPGLFIAIGGWALLFLPVVVALIVYLGNR